MIGVRSVASGGRATYPLPAPPKRGPALEESSLPKLDPALRHAVDGVLSRLPCGLFVMTASHEDRSHAVMIHAVVKVSHEPPLILVALPKGQAIVPLLHDSHAFAVCQLSPEDRLLMRKLGTMDGADQESLHGVEMLRRATGAPILARAQCFLDCELVRHADVDGDHDIYVGLIREGGILHGGEVAIRFGDAPHPHHEQP